MTSISTCINPQERVRFCRCAVKVISLERTAAITNLPRKDKTMNNPTTLSAIGDTTRADCYCRECGLYKQCACQQPPVPPTEEKPKLEAVARPLVKLPQFCDSDIRTYETAECDCGWVLIALWNSEWRDYSIYDDYRDKGGSFQSGANTLAEAQREAAWVVAEHLTTCKGVG